MLVIFVGYVLPNGGRKGQLVRFAKRDGQLVGRLSAGKGIKVRDEKQFCVTFELEVALTKTWRRFCQLKVPYVGC